MTERVATVIKVTFIATHVFKCHIRNRSLYVYKIAKEDMPTRENVIAREYNLLNSIGIYLLFDKINDNTTRVYVGKGGLRLDGNGILSRISEHKDYSHVLVVIDKTWTGADISYLENKFYTLATQTGLVVCNRNTPNHDNLEQADQESLNEAIGYITLLMKLMGHGEFDNARRLNGLY